MIDDGSSDASPELARAAAERDTRVRAIALPQNVGISRSLNRGLQEARAGIVAIQDADDFSEPRRLEREAAVLEEQVRGRGGRMPDARGGRDGSRAAAPDQLQGGRRRWR